MFFKKVLIATDGTARSERAAEVAIAMAKNCDAALDILSVANTGKPRTAMEIDPDFIEEVSDDGEMSADPVQLKEQRTRPEHKFVDHIAEMAKKEGVSAVTTEVRVGRPAEDEILAYAEELGSDVIVVGSHGRRPLTTAIKGSVTTSLVHAGSIPVLVVPAKED